MVLLRAGVARVPPSEDWISVLFRCPGIKGLQSPRWPTASRRPALPTSPECTPAVGCAAAFRAACSRGCTKADPGPLTITQPPLAYPSLTFHSSRDLWQSLFFIPSCFCHSLSHLWCQQQGDQVLAHGSVTSRWRQVPLHAARTLWD